MPFSSQAGGGRDLPPFRAGGDFTLGAEDELLLVAADGSPSEPDGVVERVMAMQPGRPVSPEIFRGLIEFGTPVCADAGELAGELARSRAALGRAGQDAIAIGVHPTADFGEFHTVHSERYDLIREQFAGILRTATAAFQVHVGVPDTVTLVAALRALRNALPLLRGLAASSPFWHGRDSGLASTRGALLRSYPRTGPPPAFGSYDEYESVARQTMAAAEVPGYTYVWWDVRPQPRFGTLEVRVMDAQSSVERAAGLAALIQGIVRAAAEEPPAVDLPDVVLDENDFRAVRYGLDARLVDTDGRLRPLRELAADAIGRARAALAGEATTAPLDRLRGDLDREPEDQRQRRLREIGGMTGLLADLMARTAGGPVGPVE